MPSTSPTTPSSSSAWATKPTSNQGPSPAWTARGNFDVSGSRPQRVNGLPWSRKAAVIEQWIDYTQEETFNQALFELLREDTALRHRFFVAHTGIAASQVSVRHRDRTHTLDSRKIELDLYLHSERDRHHLVIELKGSGGVELPGQTASIRETLTHHYPEDEHTLIFASLEGTPAQEPAFLSMTLESLLSPLRSAPPTTNVTNFLQCFDRDTRVDAETPTRRKQMQAHIKRLRTQLQQATGEIIANTPALKNLHYGLVRSYSKSTTEVHIEDRRWRGLAFVFTIRAAPDLSLETRCAILKGGRRNASTLKSLRKSTPPALIELWRAQGATVNDSFKHKNYDLLTTPPAPFDEGMWRETLKGAIEGLLIPAIPTFNDFSRGWWSD